MEQTPEQEVLIARNNETGQVGAVVGQNPDGTPKMADVKSTPLSELVKFTKGQNPLEAFTANFMRQAKNPTTFGIFKMSAEDYEALAEPMAEMLNDPETNKEMLDKYRVEMKAPAVKIQPVDPDKVNWAEIEQQWGIKREDLEKDGALQQMKYHHKSPKLYKVNDPDKPGEKIEARLSFRSNPDGTYSLTPHFVKEEPQLDQPFRGYTFTAEDKEALTNTGNLGKAVDLKDPVTGETQKCLVSIDRLTNEIECVPVDKIYIRQKVANIDLTMQQIGILKNGGLIKEQHVELPNGQKFTADLQYNASKGDVAFVNSALYRQENEQKQQEGEKSAQSQGQKDNWHNPDGNPKRLSQWYHIPLDEQKQADYLAGKQVLVGETKDNKGNDCTMYLQYDPKERKPQTTWVYPDRDKVVGIAEEHKTQVAVNNDGKTNEATKNVKEPLQRGQTEPKDDTQQKKQQRSSRSASEGTRKNPRTPKP